MTNYTWSTFSRGAVHKRSSKVTKGNLQQLSTTVVTHIYHLLECVVVITIITVVTVVVAGIIIIIITSLLAVVHQTGCFS